MMIARALTASVLLAGGTILACSGGGGSTGGGAGTSTGFIDEYCAVVGQCCGQSGYPSDGATCRAFAGQSATGRDYNAAKGDECLAALRAQASSNPSFCSDGTSAPACNEVFRANGAAAAGATCEDDSDCAPSPEGEVDCTTTISNNATTKTCQVRVRGKEGDACTATRDGNVTSSSGSGDRDGGAPPAKVTFCDTADQLYCDSTKKSCTRMGEVGADCASSASSYACVKSAFCDTAQKKCAPRLAADDDCSVVTARNACVEDHYCDETTKKCTPSIADGAACQTNNQCKSGRCTNGKCAESGTSSLVLTLLCGPKPGG